MAKELPYFKFEPNQWENGNIQICHREDKGLFMDLCSMYWSRLGDVPLKLAIQKLCNGNATAFDLLLKEQIFIVKNGYVCIDFLNEQLLEFENISNKNSENARIGWEKRRKDATASKSQSEIDAIRGDDSKEDKIKKDKINTKTLLSEIKISDLENEDLEYFEIAKAFRDLFVKNLKEKNAPAAHQKNAKYKAYVHPIRLMMTNDGVTKEQMTKVFKYLDSPQGEFWKSNILSTNKLREKFQQLILKSQANGKQVNNQTGADQEFRNKTAKRLGIIKS